VIESIEKETVAMMCIESPFTKKWWRFRNIFSTHPSIEDRIKALENY
jgi:Zn-dependent protease with chaperone function